MPKYCIEKFESSLGQEKVIYWRQDKHVHDATLITTIARGLGTRFGGTWNVRANSYRSNQSTVPPSAVDANDL